MRFVRADFFELVIKKIKHDRLTQIIIAVFMVLVISVTTVVLIKRNQKEEEKNFEEDLSEQITDNTVDVEEKQVEEVIEKETYSLPIEGIRPYAVMIDNEGTRPLPQGGLHKAQIIYEVIVEGGETRYMPIFWKEEIQGKDEAQDIFIGPVRSSRHYFLDYVLEHDAIYVHIGYSPKALKDIPKLKINNINGVASGGEIFWDITKDPYNWQDTYTSMSKIDGYVKKVNYRTETDKKGVLSYNEADTELVGGVDASNVKIKYNQLSFCEYIFDLETNQYNRFRKDKPHMERATEQQLTTKNIIIQFNKNYTIPGDREDRQEVETTGSGEGWYITLGKAIKIKWTKNSRSEATNYLDEQGNPIKMNPGPTWIQIVPTYGKVEFPE